MKYKILYFLIISMTVGKLAAFSQEFVYLENSRFKYRGENFYPIVMNYGVNYRTDGTNYWAVPRHGYGRTNDIECTSKVNCLEAIKADMQLLKELGFNTVRLVEVHPYYVGSKLAFRAYTSNSVWQTKVDVLLKSDYSTYFRLISDIIDVIEEVGLKAIILSEGPFNDPIRENYLSTFLNRFKNNPTILAYDLINEPLYEDDITSSKSEVCEIVSKWRDMIDAYAPNHLLTIGFANSSEILRWDPNILPIDFASFHPYGKLEEVMNEIYYYGQFINKPWIIGETGLSADNITVTYEKQRDFAEKTLKRVMDCNGKGYSWWQYQDVSWGSYQSDYLGLLSNQGITYTSNPELVVEGTPKPTAQEFEKFNSYIPNNDCDCLYNFYNYFEYNGYVITGRLINGSTNRPIRGGVVIGKDKNWNNTCKTFTDNNGQFNLYSNVKLFYLKASAPGMNRVEYNANWNGNYISITNNELNIGSVKTYKTSNTISTSNYIVKGNGTSGGKLTMYAGQSIIFNSGFAVEKGGMLTAEPKYNIGDIKVYPIKSCYNSTKFQKPLDQTNETKSYSNSNYNDEFDVTIYPNPTKGVININSNYNIDKLIVYNQNGQTIVTYNDLPANVNFDFSRYPKGLYLIHIYANNKMENLKLIIE